MYVALIRVGEASGSLDQVLEVLADERSRTEALRRKVAEAIRYPPFVLVAAGCVLLFFLTFVLPQFASVLHDFGAKVDPILAIPESLDLPACQHRCGRHRPGVDADRLLAVAAATCGSCRRAGGIHAAAAGAPGDDILPDARCFAGTSGVLLGSGVNLTTTLRILVDMMATAGPAEVWTEMVDRVRHGAKLSDALAETDALPAMAVRMLRLGDETGQLPMLAGRVAEFYEAKLQRTLDRVVGIAGPAAIIVISLVVGGLIVSVMTALISVSQIVG